MLTDLCRHLVASKAWRYWNACIGHTGCAVEPQDLLGEAQLGTPKLPLKLFPGCDVGAWSCAYTCI